MVLYDLFEWAKVTFVHFQLTVVGRRMSDVDNFLFRNF